VDVCYAIYYPLTEKYVSLYPRKNGNDYSKGCETSVEKKPDMWEIVRKNMAEGTLDALREGTSTTLSNAGMNRRAITARAPKPKYNSKSVEFGSKSIKTEEQDEESDGGFFEEGSDGGGVP